MAGQAGVVNHKPNGVGLGGSSFIQQDSSSWLAKSERLTDEMKFFEDISTQEQCSRTCAHHSIFKKLQPSKECSWGVIHRLHSLLKSRSVGGTRGHFFRGWQAIIENTDGRATLRSYPALLCRVQQSHATRSTTVKTTLI